MTREGSSWNVLLTPATKARPFPSCASEQLTRRSPSEAKETLAWRRAETLQVTLMLPCERKVTPSSTRMDAAEKRRARRETASGEKDRTERVEAASNVDDLRQQRKLQADLGSCQSGTRGGARRDGRRTRMRTRTRTESGSTSLLGRRSRRVLEEVKICSSLPHRMLESSRNESEKLALLHQPPSPSTPTCTSLPPAFTKMLPAGAASDPSRCKSDALTRRSPPTLTLPTTAIDPDEQIASPPSPTVSELDSSEIARGALSSMLLQAMCPSSMAISSADATSSTRLSGADHVPDSWRLLLTRLASAWERERRRERSQRMSSPAERRRQAESERGPETWRTPPPPG
eukprot:756537-Hanusia_phi.AAC.4